MTNKSISELIGQLNGDQLVFPYVICKYQISKTVEYAKVWDNIMSEIKSATEFYFIKKEDKYVGAVNLLITNLHWYILEEERNKGYLTNALKTSIIPHFFNKYEIDYVKISIEDNIEDGNNPIASKKVAQKLGFKNISDEKYVLDKDLFDFSNTSLSIKHAGLNENDYEILISEIKNIAARLQQIHTFIEFTTGKNMVDYQEPSIGDLATQLNTRRWSLEDMYHDHLMTSED